MNIQFLKQAIRDLQIKINETPQTIDTSVFKESIAIMEEWIDAHKNDNNDFFSSQVR